MEGKENGFNGRLLPFLRYQINGESKGYRGNPGLFQQCTAAVVNPGGGRAGGYNVAVRPRLKVLPLCRFIILHRYISPYSLFVLFQPTPLSPRLSNRFPESGFETNGKPGSIPEYHWNIPATISRTGIRSLNSSSPPGFSSTCLRVCFAHRSHPAKPGMRSVSVGGGADIEG